jgi:hypothetical protein
MMLCFGAKCILDASADIVRFHLFSVYVNWMELLCRKIAKTLSFHLKPFYNIFYRFLVIILYFNLQILHHLLLQSQ